MIRFGLTKDKEELLQLVKESYPIKDQVFYDYYFQQIYKDGDALIQEMDNRLVSQIHRQEEILHYKNKKILVSYLLGICTHYDYRRRGMMEDLMNMTLEDAEKKHILTFMEASNPRLFEKYGFEVMTYRRRYVVYAKELMAYNINGVSEEWDAAVLKIIYDRFISVFDGYFERDIHYFEEWIDRCILENYSICVHQDEEGNYDGYAIYVEKDDGIEIKEILYLNSRILFKLMKYAIGYMPYISVEVSQNERLDKMFKLSIPRDMPSLMVRINDVKLFNKLFNMNVKNTKDFVSTIKKPLWFNDKY